MQYKIADLVVEMNATGRTAAQAAPYLTQDAAVPDICVSCDPIVVLAVNPALENLDDAFYLGSGADFARELLAFDGLQLHASALVDQGKAYLFSGPSGLEKSTHTALWQRLFDAKILNDDKPALRRLDGSWYAYGTPWSGKYDRSINARYPLGGVCFLRRGEKNSARRLTPADALPMFLSQTPHVLNRENMERLMTLVDQLLEETPLWQVICATDEAAAMVARAALTQTPDKEEA